MIEFIQYKRPNGRTEIVSINRPEDIELLANRVREEKTGVFEIEQLMTGDISMTIHLAGIDDDIPIAHEICPNGPEVPEAIDGLVKRAYKVCFQCEAFPASHVAKH